MCGIFGVVGSPKAAELTLFGLHAIQHRAQDYAGMVSSDGKYLYRETGDGIARKVFTADKLNRLHGRDALGQIRYPTVVDDPTRDNIQPIVGSYGKQPIAIAHNGNLTNVAELEKLLGNQRMSTSMDTEYILRLLEKKQTGTLEEDLASIFALLKGSFTLGILLPNRLIGVCDKSSNRPLVVGKLQDGYCIASEDCAFPNVGAKYVCEIPPGTMALLGPDGVRMKKFAEPKERRCTIERIYFEHAASDGVARFRMRIGEELERLFPVLGADIVTPIPESAMPIAQGYAESRNTGSYLQVIHKSGYVGRSFIAPTQIQRDTEVANKFIFNAGEIKGKVIVVVDDSVFRETTLLKVVRQLRELEAKAVHVRIACPPVKHPCIYGVHTPTVEELVSTSHTTAQIRREVGADSLRFLPLESLRKFSPNPGNFCFACWDGNYW